MAVELWLLCCSVALLAGCGGSRAAKPCETPAQKRALTRLDRDLAALERAADRGNVDRETDRFLLDVQTAPVDDLVRNRMIDHAAAIVAPVCEQCFLALEGQRPIVGIAHAHTGAACRATG